MSICVFACDHRPTAEWDLPYIRFGGPESSCAVRCPANEVLGEEAEADEVPKICWLWENLGQFGCDVVGYCQYRRFFSRLATGLPVVDFPAPAFRREFAMTPGEQEAAMAAAGADGILHPHFKVVDERRTPYTYVWEQIGILEGERMLPSALREKAFSLLLSRTPERMKDAMEKAFRVRENYLCNIFTAKAAVFREFGETAFPAAADLLRLVGAGRSRLHQYWLAYVFERFTSCWFHAAEISGRYRFLKVPLATIDGSRHVEGRV